MHQLKMYKNYGKIGLIISKTFFLKSEIHKKCVDNNLKIY